MNISRIAQTTADTLLAAYAGQTISQDEVYAQIDTQYAMNKKRTAVSSFFQVHYVIERAGAKLIYSGPNYTGTASYTFP